MHLPMALNTAYVGSQAATRVAKEEVTSIFWGMGEEVGVNV